jgi:myo-inositol-1(or 4)-monophosphatase
MPATRRLNSALKHWTKGKDAPVAEADIAVDHLLQERLLKIAPDAGWLSEETDDDRSRLDKPRVWVVDPIDGTRAYIAGLVDWTISAALVERPSVICFLLHRKRILCAVVEGRDTTGNGCLPATATASTARAGPADHQTAHGDCADDVLPRVHSLRCGSPGRRGDSMPPCQGDSHDWDLTARSFGARSCRGVNHICR